MGKKRGNARTPKGPDPKDRPSPGPASSAAQRGAQARRQLGQHYANKYGVKRKG